MRRLSTITASWSTGVLVIAAIVTGCGKNSSTPATKTMPSDKEFAGFLKDYTNLKPNPEFDGTALTYAKSDAQKNLHRYIAIIVDPVDVYLASNAEQAELPEKSRQAAANYYRKALIDAVSGAFPVTDQPGPLVLRLRAAIIGVDSGKEIAAADRPTDVEDAMDRTVNIGKVGVEMELLDSETNEQIAAMVDREKLGTDAEIGSVTFSKQERWAAAREAFDEWARRVRHFLDSAHTLTGEDAKRADQSYRPYGVNE